MLRIKDGKMSVKMYWEPELKYTDKGLAIWTYQGTNQSRIKRGEEWVDDPNSKKFRYKLVAFGDTAEYLGNLGLNKGDELSLLEAEIKQPAGSDYFLFEIVVRNAERV